MATETEVQRRPLTQEERNDLRKKVLRGEQLTLDEARSVYETLRQGQATVSAELTKEGKPKRARKASAPATDDQLNADLDRLLPSM